VRGDGRPVNEHGSATVLLVAVVAAATIVVGSVLAAAGARVVSVRAQSTADAAALAGAAAAVRLVSGAPCDAASRVARRGGADLTGCSTSGAFVRVVVELRSGPLRLGATAVAGPRRTPADRPDRHRPAGIPATVCMVCLSARRSSMSRSTRTLPCPRADSTIDQGVTCQARRSS